MRLSSDVRIALIVTLQMQVENAPPTAFRPIFPLILDSCHGGSCFDVNFSRAPTLLAINVDYSREILQFHRISTQLSCPSPLFLATQQNMPRPTLKANKKLNSACFAKWSKISAVWCGGCCSYWHVASNPTRPGELSWKEKYPPFSQTLPAVAICIQPSFFCLL